MKQKLLLIAFALISIMLKSQTVSMAFEEWKKTDGTQNFFYRNIVKTDGSSNVFTAGATMNASNGTTDILLTKRNSAGVTLWSKVINGTANTGDFAAGMLISGSDVYITGTITNNTLTMVPELFLAKYNSSGTQQFFTTFSNGYGDIGRDIIINATYNYIIVTGASGDNTFQSDILAVAFNSSGTVQWNTTYDYNGLNDGGYKIATKSAICTVTGPVTQGVNSYKLVTLSFSVATGAQSGSVTVGATATSSVEIISDLVTDASGNFYLCGATQQNAGQGYDYYVAKVTSSLTVAWEQTVNGNANSDDFGRGIKVDASGNVFVTGVTTHSTQGQNITTVKYNSSGTLQWTQNVNGNFNGEDAGNDMEIDASGNIYVVGYQSRDASNKDFYTIKYNTSGTKIWDKFTDGFAGDDMATNVALDTLNNIIVTGTSRLDGTNKYLTSKLVQADIKNPVDLNGEATNRNIGFHPNRGQIKDESGNSNNAPLYYTHNQNPEIFIEQGRYNYVFASIDTVATTNDSLERIAVSFSLSTAGKTPHGYDEKTYPLHYFLGSDIGDPIVDIRGYDRVVTQDLYPNIDLHYYSNKNGFKYYFVVREGGDPRDIKINIAGATSTSITANNLFINGVLGDVTLKRPLAYMVNGSNVTTTLSASSYASMGSNTYSLTTPSYTTTQTLIIIIETVAPSMVSSMSANLDYSTFYGGNGTDYFKDIKAAPNGDRYVTGYSSGGNFPTTTGALFANPFPIGSYDATVLKYTADDTLRFCTFFGGNGVDNGYTISHNSKGQILFGGFTQSTDLYISNFAGHTNQAYNGNNVSSSTNTTDGFLIKLNPKGNVRLFGRYIGGQRSEWLNSIYIDSNDKVYLTGTTSSDDFPVANAWSSTHGTTSSDDFDVFVGKIDSSQVVEWFTYFGGNAVTGFQTQEYGHDITVDNSGNVFVVGESDETTFPTTNPNSGNANLLYDNSLGGYSDGFIARFTSSGTRDYATYLGGSQPDRLNRVLYDPTTSNLYFAGNSSSTSGLPIKSKVGAYNDAVRRANPAIFLGYINSSLEHQWVTYYGRGGSSKSFALGGLSRDNTGMIYISGQAYSDTLVYGATTPSGAYVDNTVLMTDGFVAVFDVNKQIYHAHYFGGLSNDYINNSDCNGTSYLYVVGNTGSSYGNATASNNFPIAYTSYNATLIDSTLNNGVGSNDGFISRFNLYAYNFVGVKENTSQSNNIIVFPNPANNFVTLMVNTGLSEKLNLKVYNTMGQIVYEDVINGNEKTIDCNKWANGMYIFMVNNKDINSSFKIIKN
ncbi:MAG: T9SS type A sorting domain-containing protein [Bacteroidota bacterium]